MSQKCVLRLSTRWPTVRQLSPHGTSTFGLCSTQTRYNSSVPERSRKLPGSKNGSRLQPWQRALLIGAAAGFCSAQAWKYYHEQSQKRSFIPYKLVAREPVSSTASIFHLEAPDTAEDYQKFEAAWRRGIWNVQFKQPQMQIVRAYTPLPAQAGTEVHDDDNDNKKKKKHKHRLRFLIRHDPHGEVSSYLHRLPIGADIELRGPNLEYEIAANVKQVVFYAGGTGIAPALQVAHAMFDTAHAPGRDPRHQRKLHILWANRKREDCQGGVSDEPVKDPMLAKRRWSTLFSGDRAQKPAPPTSTNDEQGPIVKELEDLKQEYPGQVTVEYFVNAEGTFIDEEAVVQSLSRFDNKDFSSGMATEAEQRQILVSGPNGFISYLAGPKEWRHGREEQGPVSKIIAHAIAQNPHHVRVCKI